jgi:nucleotide-binding universal stress UspA family protein
MSSNFKDTVDAELQRAPKEIVVGVDGSRNNHSAVVWAAAEAARSHAHLRLVQVTEALVSRTPWFVTEPADVFNPVKDATRDVKRVAAKVKRDQPGVEVTTAVRVSPTLKGLVDESREAAMVVVGKRGMGAIKRVIIGSTSIGLAGRATVPTVVVPDGWNQADHAFESVLVGIDPAHETEQALAFGFERAHELGVPLVVLHVWTTHPTLVPSDEDLKRWGHEAQLAVESLVAPWRAKFPDVEALAAHRHAPPALGLLDASDQAQLLVLGRRSTGSSHLGLGFGSVARSVLHYAERPVAVVPSISAV